MSLLASVVLVVHLLIAIAICGFVLLQHGKGADMGAAFGSGSSGSVFGAAGSANFLSRTTGILAFLFFVSSVALTLFGSMHVRSGGGLMDRVGVPTAPAAGSTVPGTPTLPAKAGDAALPGNAAGAAGGATGSAAVPAGSAVVPPKTGAGVPTKSSEVPK